jgi:hypothetical protein
VTMPVPARQDEAARPLAGVGRGARGHGRRGPGIARDCRDPGS